jgi:hypothetical protein
MRSQDSRATGFITQENKKMKKRIIPSNTGRFVAGMAGILLLLCTGPVAAQTTAQTAVQPTNAAAATATPELVQRASRSSRRLAQLVKPLCQTSRCFEPVADLEAALAKLDDLQSRQTLTRDAQTQFGDAVGTAARNVMTALVAENPDMEAQLNLAMQAPFTLAPRTAMPGSRVPETIFPGDTLGDGLSVIRPLDRQADCYSNCDRLMVGVTAVCSLYLAAPVGGAIAAAICEAAAIYGYQGCLRDCSKIKPGC